MPNPSPETMNISTAYKVLWAAGLIVPPPNPKSRLAQLILLKEAGKLTKELKDPRE